MKLRTSFAASCAAFALIWPLAGGELPLRIYNPKDSSPSSDGGEPRPVIYEDTAKLIAHFKERKDSAFITADGANAGLKWHAEHLIIISPELVSVSMTEGHLDVTGIYVRNHQAKSWDILAEHGGKFRDRSLTDVEDAKPGPAPAAEDKGESKSPAD